MNALLQVDALTLGPAARPLVHMLRFAVQPGERWCVIGRNAAGKSTLLRALAGLPAPTGMDGASGTVILQGDAKALAEPTRAARLRAYLPQQPSDRFELTVRELLALQSHGPAPAGEDIDAIADALDVAPLLERAVTRLSGGERQRVGLAAVAAQRTPLWLLDEPVSFQDPAHQQLVAYWLSRHAGGIVMSAHDMGWVQQTATHLIALQDGGRWVAGPLAAVLTGDTLRATFACDWRQAGGVWLAGAA